MSFAFCICVYLRIWFEYYVHKPRLLRRDWQKHGNPSAKVVSTNKYFKWNGNYIVGFFFSHAVRYGTVTISISLNSAIGTTHQRCSLFYNKNSQLIYGWLESIETLWKALLVPRKCTLTMQFSFEIACSVEKSNTSCCRHFSRRKSPVIHCWRLNLWFLIRFILV